ncbi:MAG: sulfotransferase family protein [Phycisphaeraceae bacterium]
MPTYPNLITIGAMKAGTTLLHRLLGRHPEIHASPVKEPNFFCHPDRDRFRRAYRALFDEHARYNLESSISYARAPRAPWVPAAIAEECPDVKLIYVVRDPLDRMISQHAEAIDQFREHRSLRDYLRHTDGNPECPLETSLYGYQLQRFLDHFPRERIHIMVYERLVQDPAAELRRLGVFLGLDGLEAVGASLPVVNAGHTKRGQNALGRWLARRPFGRHLATSPHVPWRLREFVKWLGRIGAAPLAPEPLDDDTERLLIGKLSPDVRRLETFLQRPITAWPRFSGKTRDASRRGMAA